MSEFLLLAYEDETDLELKPQILQIRVVGGNW